MTAYLEFLKTEIRTWRDARVQVCEVLGKSDEDIAKLDVWICSEFSIDAMPSFNGDAIKQKAFDFRRACNTYALVTELEKLPSTVAAVDAMAWYANGTPTDKAIIWPLISRLYRKLELELPEDTRGLFETWLSEDDLGREAIRIKLQVSLNAYRIASTRKLEDSKPQAMITGAGQTNATKVSAMNVRELFGNVTSQNAAFGWSCGFTDDSHGAPGNMEFKKKAARFDGITVKNHMLWWDDWSFVETLKEYAQQEYPSLEPIASKEFESEYVAARLSGLHCLSPDGRKAWGWGEIALLLESLDRNQMRSFGDFWLAPDGTRAVFHTDRLVEVLANCYTSPINPVKPAIEVEVGELNPDELTEPLTDNDRDILIAMLEAGSSKVSPTKGDRIIRLALGSGDKNKAFKRLVANRLVESKGGKGGGYWLTMCGLKIAKGLTNHKPIR